MTDSSTSFGFSLFCDDIRQEIGGKLSVMGMYQSEMIFPAEMQLPIVVPKFSILVKYFEVAGMYNEDLALKIFGPSEIENPLFEQSVVRNEAADFPQGFAVPPDSDKLLSMNFPIFFSPFVISQFGYFKVRMQRGEKSLKLGSLLIKKAEVYDTNKPQENLISPT